MKKIIKIIIGMIILILVLYFGIVFYLVYINQEKDLESLRCNFTNCELFRYNFTNALANLDNKYNISIEDLRRILKNG